MRYGFATFLLRLQVIMKSFILGLSGCGKLGRSRKDEEEKREAFEKNEGD